MSLGATASTLRKARGLSLSDVEQITKINKGALSKFERGLEGLGPEKFDRLCVLFGTTPSVLYAIANTVSKRPELLLDGDKLHRLVRRLTKLIDNYLLASEDVRLQVDKLLD